LVTIRIISFSTTNNDGFAKIWNQDFGQYIFNTIFIEQLKNFIMNNDLVIGISGSGNSKNILNAINYANKVGARTFGIIGCDGGKLKNIAQISLIINSFDMQKIEDCHMILTHLTMQYFSKKFAKEMVVT